MNYRKKKSMPKLNVDAWGIAKKAVGMVASGCATIVVSKCIKAAMPEAENFAEKVAMTVGLYFITGIVGSEARKYAEHEMDEMRESLTQVVVLEDTEE